MNEPEQPDLVDVFYVPFIRALGNLVIIYAQAEAALIELVAALVGCEKAAHELMKAQDCKDQVLALIRKSIFTGFQLSELIAGVEKHWSDKEIRNRLMHDECYVGIEEGPTAVPSTRGMPRKKNSDVVWANPKPLDIWKLAYSFQNNKQLFSYSAYELKRRYQRPKAINECGSSSGARELLIRFGTDYICKGTHGNPTTSPKPI